ncbi:MAG: hypothetical protein K6E28_03085 [Eubacterium sp.]|nr:hypothetical protein [Eubacterium sp.]
MKLKEAIRPVPNAVETINCEAAGAGNRGGKNTHAGAENSECSNHTHTGAGNRGSITVEASFIMGIVVIIVYLSVYGYIYTLDREIARANVNEAIYTVTVNDPEEHIKNAEGGGNPLIWTEADYAGSVGSGDVSMSASFDMKGKTVVTGKTEYDVCTDRLRRWQLYGDLAEE